jgi:hypothetical protein
MKFDHLSFSPIIGLVKLGLIMCLLWYPHSRVQSGRKIVCLHFFLDFSHVFIFLPLIPVMFTDYFGISDACRQILTVVKMVVCPYTGHSIYIQEEFIVVCLARLVLEDSIGVINQKFSCCQDKYLFIPFTLK